LVNNELSLPPIGWRRCRAAAPPRGWPSYGARRCWLLLKRRCLRLPGLQRPFEQLRGISHAILRKRNNPWRWVCWRVERIRMPFDVSMYTHVFRPLVLILRRQTSILHGDTNITLHNHSLRNQPHQTKHACHKRRGFSNRPYSSLEWSCGRFSVSDYVGTSQNLKDLPETACPPLPGTRTRHAHTSGFRF